MVDFLISASVIIFVIILGLFILLQDIRRSYARVFFLMCVMVVAWIMSSFAANTLDDVVLAGAASKLAFLFGFYIVYSGLIFTYLFPVRREVSRTHLMALVVIFVVMSCFSLLDSVVGRAIMANGQIQFLSGNLWWLYLIGFLGVVVAIILNLSSRHFEHKERVQSNIVAGAFVLSAVFGLLLNLVLPVLTGSWTSTQVGPLSVIILVAMISYAIIRHGLFDIRLVAVRSFAYILSLSTLALVYFGIAYILSTVLLKGAPSAEFSANPLNVMLALVLTIAFQPVKDFFDKITDRIFFRDRYNIDRFIADVGEVSTSTTSLNTLLKRSSKVISNTLRLSYASFLVYRDDKQHYTTIGSTSAPRILAGEHAILAAINFDDDIILIDQDVDPKLYEVAARHDIKMIVRLGKVGYLLLGEQMGYGYKSRDVRAIRAIKNELIIAIQNVRSVQEVRDLNMYLQQRIDEATKELRASNNRLRKLDETKDEFMSIASHQLRTPLTSIKGYLSMILEGDLGRVPASQKKVLKEALGSSERMVNLISDFLNISRLQTGKFVIDHVETNLEKLVATEVKNLQQSAKSRDLTLEFHPSTKKIPTLYADDVKLRQVVMNFIDNALYYSRAKGKTDVYIERKAGFVEVRVVDYGIGVPKAERERLFTKFFRASNALKRRPDGTGVGLFLAKKVIDGHGGEIIFNSRENRGSTFGFRLPISPLSTPPKT